MVALLAEGVDRNTLAVRFGLEVGVALLAEGVDRNVYAKIEAKSRKASPSSRRAWIEILPLQPCGVMMSSRPPRGGRG